MRPLTAYVRPGMIHSSVLPYLPHKFHKDTIFVNTFEDFLQKFLVIFMITLLSSFALLGGLLELVGGFNPLEKY